MKIPKEGKYKCHNYSLYLRVLKVHHVDSTKIKMKIQFEYKDGTVCEVKNYTVPLSQIQHWEQVFTSTV